MTTTSAKAAIESMKDYRKNVFWIDMRLQYIFDFLDANAPALLALEGRGGDGERVQILIDALEHLSRLGNGDRLGNSEGNIYAQAALVKFHQLAPTATQAGGGGK